MLSFGLAAVWESAVAAGTIASRKGNASVTPAPLSIVRREMCFFVMNTRSFNHEWLIPGKERWTRYFVYAVPASIRDSAVSTHDPARFLPILMLLFAGSGCSALIYEIVWFQLLQLAIGSTAVSLGVLLATLLPD